MDIPMPNKIVPTKTSGNMKDKYAVFIAKLMQARTATHMMHLMTDSYARHKALNGFYDAIAEQLDVIAEAALGEYGKPMSMSIESLKVSVDSEEKYLKDLRDICQDARDECKSTNLQNEIDNVLTLIDKTLYLFTLK
jgi:DNA-binding ferritin-like protein